MRLLILSDVHYAGAEEKQRKHYEISAIESPFWRWVVKYYRYFIWMRDPFAHNHLLDYVLNFPERVDFAVANGDFSCDSAFVGVSDPAAMASAVECLGKLRARFSPNFKAVMGDHELGKLTLAGRKGGMRLASWEAATVHLGIEPFWAFGSGNYTLAAVPSSLVALPIYLAETLPEEREQWQSLRQRYLRKIDDFFASLPANERLILFCHDPSALPFLWELPSVQAKASSIERTILGHLHTPLVMSLSSAFAGMPSCSFLGQSLRRMTTALNRAKYWRPFKPLLCPALTGVQLLKDGGFLIAELGEKSATFSYKPIRW